MLAFPYPYSCSTIRFYVVYSIQNKYINKEWICIKFLRKAAIKIKLDMFLYIHVHRLMVLGPILTDKFNREYINSKRKTSK